MRRDSMTDDSHSVTTTTGHDFSPVPFAHAPSVVTQRHGALPMDGTQEDDGSISCICGFSDDDGWSVACDSCNRWQHQVCYYPQYEDRSLPEDLSHYCVDCSPRPIDRAGAHAKQRVKREEQELANGLRRQPPKSHKKKIREPVYTNGWSLEKSRHDRNSASPRDQPPPAKRPKTSHHTSDSVNTTSAKGHSRKRNASSANHRRSLSRSPDSPIQVYSAEFVRCYTEDHWTAAESNLHSSIDVTNALSNWLNAPDDAFTQEHGRGKTEVLMRWDGKLEDIPGKAQLDVLTQHDETYSDGDNNYPSWKYVTVEESVAGGAYLGEIKGHVGFKEEYRQDPSNRWSQLRHPEPFVFFHPQLPIYIDARSEGTEERYVRRSCNPNAKLQILVTDSTDYRFCLMATQQIDPGMEVAVGWDTSDSIPRTMERFHQGNQRVTDKDMDQLSWWVSMCLSQIGPCACQLGPHCKMARFDRRGVALEYEEEAQPVKMPKSKKKKAGQHISPLNTHVNSRSGSEARKVEADDEPTDSRSASGSAGRGSASRDITPNTHYSHTGSTSAIPELSERERKKLAKEEEMFRRQEEERSGKQGKKKRNSGGSALSTPSATASKPLGFGSSKYTDAGTSKQAGLPSAKPGRRPKAVNGQSDAAKSVTRVVKRPKMDYVDSGIQCDLEQEIAQKAAQARAQSSPPRRPFLSTTQRLLQRCAMNNARRKDSTAPVKAKQSIKLDDVMDVDHVATGRLPSPSAVSPGTMEPEPVLRPGLSSDTEMKDAPSNDSDGAPAHVESDGPQTLTNEPSSTPASPEVPSHLPAHQPAPPWPSQVSHTAPEVRPPSLHHHHKPTDMHVQMPPPPANPFASASSPSQSTTGTLSTLTGGSMLHSPASLSAPTPSLFSPSVTAAVTPSPAKKKMSLSEYSKARKVKNEAKTGDRDSSPASAAGSVPSLLPQGSSVAAADEDVKMEDGGGDATKN